MLFLGLFERNYYKVRQTEKDSRILKYLLERLKKHYYSVTGIIKWDRIYYEVWQVLQSVARSDYKVWQILQSVAIITKWDVIEILWQLLISKCNAHLIFLQFNKSKHKSTYSFSDNLQIILTLHTIS